MLKAILAVVDHFVCIYGCGFTGTYEAVQAHQSVAHGYGR